MAKTTGSVLTYGMRGTAGTVVFVTLPSGVTYVKTRTQPRNPQTPAQQEARARLRRASFALQSLSPAQAAAWRAFAEELARIEGRARAWSSVFQGLASKWFQVNPAESGPPPLDPPASPLVGDAVSLEAEAAGLNRVRVRANQPNAAGITTEILLQPLRSVVRSPQTGAYRTAAFETFTVGSLQAEVETAARYVAVGARFVAVGSGQMTPVMPLGAVMLAT